MIGPLLVHFPLPGIILRSYECVVRRKANSVGSQGLAPSAMVGRGAQSSDRGAVSAALMKPTGPSGRLPGGRPWQAPASRLIVPLFHQEGALNQIHWA